MLRAGLFIIKLYANLFLYLMSATDKRMIAVVRVSILFHPEMMRNCEGETL